MLPIKRMLCPTDFSKPSYTALNVANDLALQLSAEIVLIHAIAPIQGTSTADAAISLHAREYLDQMENLAKRALKQLVLQRLSPKITAVTKVIHADPLEGIVSEAKDAGISKSAAGKTLNSFMDGVTKALKKKDGKITLIGFGTFSKTRRKARKARNPQTGEVIKIKASNVVKFKAGKKLKDAV
jgi:DNA-binding protein HU-beta